MYDECSDAYLAYCEEESAIHEGLATKLTHCYLCYLEQTGTADMSPKTDRGPLRGIARHDVTYGFDRQASARQGYDGDPYDVLVLIPCGHHLI